ncbi:putative Ig domain-containing protein [Deinococcus roseus]|uniref:Dystroglycan-type cadherin-like domain-containing protein n=1 Tax=Deinococcus roseus TaxID=392414 RepID=A0ABQ2CXD1_9DEIO|nr:putative Ig domain-containing protein [Deinococcus roseus]GGJ30365.1 hypothetical protein GCM10008938_15490 [Deinococcus roseus]
MRNWFLGASLVLMVACSGAENSASLPKDTVRISNTALSGAIISENYSASMGVMGGVSPYIITLTDGKLPAGLSLSSSGTISGTPTEKGSFTFSVQVTDANLSTKVQKYTLVVTDKPPPELSLELPGTPIKSATRIPVVLKNAENVAGGRLTFTVPEGLIIKDVQPVTGKPLVIWNIQNNVLTVDFAFTQKFFRNRNALFLQVESSKENGVYLPPVAAANYDLRDASAKKLAGTDLLTPPVKTEPVKTDPAKTTDPKTTDPKTKDQPADASQTPAGDPVDPGTEVQPENPNPQTDGETPSTTPETDRPQDNPDNTGTPTDGPDATGTDGTRETPSSPEPTDPNSTPSTEGRP